MTEATMTDDSQDFDFTEIGNRYRAVAAKAKAGKEKATAEAELLGYVENTANEMAASFEAPQLRGLSPGQREIIGYSGEQMAGVAEKAVGALNPYIIAGSEPALGAARAVEAAAFTHEKSVIMSIPGEPLFEYKPCPFLEHAPQASYVERLTDADPVMAGLYRSAMNQVYVAAHDSGRTALFSMRQLFDHFFAYLAPDKEVRESRFFAVRETGTPTGVYRSERIMYAADRWVTDAGKRDALVASERVMLAAYDELNRAHKRGPMDEKEVRQSVETIEGYIQRWIDGIDPWPPRRTG